MPTLPALHLTAEGKSFVEGISLELSRLSVASTLPESQQNGIICATMERSVGGCLSSSTNHIELEGNRETRDVAPPTDRECSPLNISTPTFTTTSPHFSRTLSMPLPWQLSQLQNRHRPGLLNRHSAPQISSVMPTRVDEISIELADSIQLVIQTMLHISPPQVFDPAKELFSACTLSVPTTSMSAMFTTMKHIDYISANMASFCDSSQSQESSSAKDYESKLGNEFDFGELLQCIGDTLSGAAAQAGVDLVIYHGEVGIKHVYVSGDESGISFASSHIVRQILNTTERGDSIELGLLVSPISTSPSVSQPHTTSESEPTSQLNQNDALRITLRISHRFAPSEFVDFAPTVPDEIRPKPYFSTLLFRHILLQIGGTLRSDLPPPESFLNGRTWEVDFVLDQVEAPTTPLCGDEQNQPTLEQLSSFGESLKGKRVTLYASVKGSFAHHLTSYLTALGMDVTPVSLGGEVDGSADDSACLMQHSIASINPTPSSARTEPLSGSPEFIFIDDDVDVLKDRLHVLRSSNPSNSFNVTPRKKPSLQANHRPRSSQQVTRVLNNLRTPTAVVILHFTSLSNYKLVKDAVQSILASYLAMLIPLPEIMVIPKPAGPRRFLIALHTAVMKPTVDPFFIPIATSPTTLGGFPPQIGSSPSIAPTSNENATNQANISATPGNSAITPSQTQLSLGKATTRPLGPRTNSDRSIKSLEGPGGMATSVLPPSPLALPDNVEYFSANAQKLGNSPSSGVVIQSPDGQTTGIYFHPRGKSTSRNPSSNSIEREKAQLPTPSRSQSTSRMVTNPNKESAVTFSSLYGVPSKTTYTPQPTPSEAAIPDIQTSSPSTPSDPPLVPAKIITTPLDSQQLKPTTPSPSSARSPSRRTSVESRRSPAVGHGELSSSSPSKRSSSRKPSNADVMDSKDTASSLPSKQKGKMATTGDANVVPPISVLIVDDNPINQTILSTFMRRKKIKYDLASNGQEAVQKWRSGGFHLILMDIQMPLMDGIQATKEIRRLEKLNSEAGYPPVSPSPEGQTPSEMSTTSSSTGSSETRNSNSPYRSSVIIVALTASSLQSDRVAALSAGCNDFLTKPVSLLWLNNKIIEWGSIKALQMWADIRPEAVRSLSSGQAQQAKNIADRLHVPSKGRVTPIPAVRSLSTMDESAAALALASSAGPLQEAPSPNMPSSSLDRADSAVRSSSVEDDHKLKAINAKTLQGDLSRRSNSRPRTQDGTNPARYPSDLIQLSSVVESLTTRETEFTTVINSPPP